MKAIRIVIAGIVLFFLVSNDLSAEKDKIHYVVMEIEGMTCPLCPVAIKKSLSRVKGVRDVNVSLREGKAWLNVDESVSNKNLIDAVKNAGSYKGRVLERRTEKQSSLFH
jgi:mercuric ion binding protein